MHTINVDGRLVSAPNVATGEVGEKDVVNAAPECGETLMYVPGFWYGGEWDLRSDDDADEHDPANSQSVQPRINDA